MSKMDGHAYFAFLSNVKPRRTVAGKDQFNMGAGFEKFNGIVQTLNQHRGYGVIVKKSGAKNQTVLDVGWDVLAVFVKV